MDWKDIIIKIFFRKSADDFCLQCSWPCQKSLFATSRDREEQAQDSILQKYVSSIYII